MERAAFLEGVVVANDYYGYNFFHGASFFLTII